MSNLDRLQAALKGEFGEDKPVALHLTIPASFKAPSVVVSPGDPFIEPDGFGQVRERWDVLVVYNPTAPDRNVTQMRKTSLRIRRAASSVGGQWVRSTGPRVPNGDNNSPVRFIVNEIEFTYDPDLQLQEE